MYLTKIFLVIIYCAVLVACADPYIVDEISLVQTIGYDTADNGVKSTVLIPSYKKREEIEVQLLDTKSSSNYDIMPRLNTKTNMPIEYGQLMMVLFGKEYSMKGIGPVIHSLCRDAKITTMLQLGVADRDASELLELTKKYQEPFFLSTMIDQNIEYGNLPLMNLKVLLFNFYGEGKDVYLPYFKIEGGDIKIDGLALFKKDKYITNVNIRETFILKLLTENSKNGSYQFPVKEPNQKRDEFILMNSIDSKAKYNVNKVESIPSISISVKMKVQVKDVPDWIDLRSENQLTQLEKMMSSYIEKEIQNFITLCQKNEVDPIGLGDLVRSRSKDWSVQEFQEIYSDLKTKVSVRIEIVQTGVGE